MSEVGIREFARRIGMSHTWVMKQIDKGRFTKLPSGRLDLEQAMSAFKDYEAERGEPDKLPDGSDPYEVFNEARARKESHLADIKGIEARVMRGEFVSVEEVERDAREVGMKLRAFCLAAPTRYAGLLENRSQREAESVLQDLFSELLTAIHDGRFLKGDEWGSGLKVSSAPAVPSRG